MSNESNVLPEADGAGRSATNNFTTKFGVAYFDDNGNYIKEPPPGEAATSRIPVEAVQSLPAELPKVELSQLEPAQAAPPVKPAQVPLDSRLAFLANSKKTVEFSIANFGKVTGEVLGAYKSDVHLTLLVPIDNNNFFTPQQGVQFEIKLPDTSRYTALAQGPAVDIPELGIKVITFIYQPVEV